MYRLELPAASRSLAIFADSKAELLRGIKALSSTSLSFGSFAQRPNGEWMAVSTVQSANS